MLCFVSLGGFPYSLSFPLVELLGIGSKGFSELIDFYFSLSSPFFWPDMGVEREGGELYELSLRGFPPSSRSLSFMVDYRGGLKSSKNEE